MNAAADWPCITACDGGTSLALSVTPNARRTEAIGLHDGRLRVRLGAPAIEGRANEVLIAWLASELGVPRRCVELRQGATARRKRVVLACEPAAVAAWLESLGLVR